MVNRNNKFDIAATDWSDGEVLYAGDTNDTFDSSYDYKISVMGDIGSNGKLSIPIGGIIAWHKSLPDVPSLPSGWVECNGGTISDVTSPMNGQTIPTLNTTVDSTSLFLRGSTTSGVTGGVNTHTHTLPSCGSNRGTIESGKDKPVCGTTSGATSARPPFINMVWIMRIK